MRHERLEIRYVETVPEPLEQGVLYVSKKYHTAIHLCACGCGIETVTPLDSVKGWVFTDDGTLRPSIGNNQFPCRSHYWITRGQIDWLAPFS